MKVRSLVGLFAALALVGCAAPGSSPSPAPGDDAQPGGTPAAVTGRVTVAAAADLRFAMEDLVAVFRVVNPGVTVEPTFGSSGTFFTQISEGAPFDVYFSADVAYPRKLEAAGLAASSSTQLYGIGQVVVWVPNESALDIEARGLESLTDPSIQAIAIANPDHAPYGRAAEAAMKAAGVYDAVASKLVLGENVAQAAQFVESGNADIGVIALSLALAPDLEGRGRYALIAVDSYPPLEQGTVVLNAAADPEAAQAFLDFVLGPDGRAILDRYGFMAPTS